MEQQEAASAEAQRSLAPAARGAQPKRAGVVGIKVASGELMQDELEDLKRRDPEVARLMARAEPRPVQPLLPEGQPHSVVHDGTPVGEVAAMAKLFNAFGTGNGSFLAVSIDQLDKVTRVRGSDRNERSMELAAGVALVRSVDPKNELEAALASQMAATHSLSMEMLAKARHTDDHEALNAYVSNAAKLGRTFTAQVEALSRLRGAGRQTVEVTHTHIDARGSQNVIGDVSPRGDGGANEKPARPHAPSALEDHSASDRVPMWSEDQGREAVPSAGGARETTLPDARRRESRGTAGAG